ncbi:MAG: helix-turn-helix domain-containing protein [Firmicutes bacterium]|nr:helix-turn-helix domain-containing protein [Bacillota bacterium]
MKLKELRERSGMSQSQLAKAAGVNYRTLQA